MGKTDLLKTAQQVLPLFQLLDADDNLVSCSFCDFLSAKKKNMLVSLLKPLDMSEMLAVPRF